jgi:hypothetical protein
VLRFSPSALIGDERHALQEVLRIGEAPVGLALFRNRQGPVVADSNRFAQAGSTANLAFVKISAGDELRLTGYVTSELFPRDLAATPIRKLLLVCNRKAPSRMQLPVLAIGVRRSGRRRISGERVGIYQPENNAPGSRPSVAEAV